MRTAAPAVRGTASAASAAPVTGPCGEAVVAGGFVFCSGAVGVDPATGRPGDGIEAQAELALRNLEAILAAAGAPPSAVTGTTVLYADAGDLPAFYAVYARVLTGLPPARSAPGRGALPSGLLVSVGAVAVLPRPR